MTYATLMVHLELGKSNAGLLGIAGDLADRFEAGIVGIAACQPMPLVYSDGGYAYGDLITDDRNEIDKEIREAEAEFRTVLQARVKTLAWRSTVTNGSLSDYLARAARGVDIVVTGVASKASVDDTRRVSTGDLVMQAGRPVLLVPEIADKLKLDRVVLGWKDTRETRRAALDALPLLKKASHVAVVEIAAEDDREAARARVEDVARWLERHGVRTETLAVASTGDDAARLNAIAQDQAADVFVAGAYGHSRLREWALGGVTRGLLLRADRCSLVSH